MSEFFSPLTELISGREEILIIGGLVCALILMVCVLIRQSSAIKRTEARMEAIESAVCERIDDARKAVTNEMELQYAEMRTNTNESGESMARVLNDVARANTECIDSFARKLEKSAFPAEIASNADLDGIAKLVCERAQKTEDMVTGQIREATDMVDGMLSSLLSALNAKLSAIDASLSCLKTLEGRDPTDGSFRQAALKLEQVNDSLEEMKKVAGEIASLRESANGGVSVAQLYALERRGQEIWSRIGEMQSTYPNFSEALNAMNAEKGKS